MTLRIANAAGFLGDNLDAPRLTVQKAAVDYLTLEYLAELTMSILARVREKNPAAGYAADFLTVLRSLIPALKSQPRLKIVTNAGGMNPHACAAEAASILRDAGLGGVRIGIVTGDDLLPALSEFQAAGQAFEHFDTAKPLAALQQPIVSANAYLGAKPIAEALAADAQIVITGRVADASLTVGPALFEHGWQWTDWDQLAAASVAGHLIECGAQVSGGFYTNWNKSPTAKGQTCDSPLDLGDVGYPIAEIEADGTSVITKPEGTGGVVNRQTVCEQLVYEVGDPAHYLTPDVDVDFTAVEVDEIDKDRVRVTGAVGNPPPNSYKVSLAYRDGFTAAGNMLVYGRDCVEKARACAQIVRQRLRNAGWTFVDKDFNVETLGTGDGMPGLSRLPVSPSEVVLRISVRHQERAAVERFTRELAPLATSGPPGLAGYAAGRSTPRPVFAYWPTTIAKECVQANVQVMAANDFPCEEAQ
ncbi:MAG: DUF1446 domain-containing protein [Pirellulales bacterium]|nr:DUF1446 domain-containing protein [Pirellulales bacterium]